MANFLCWAEPEGISTPRQVEVSGAGQAAEKYVEQYHSDLDYPTEVVVVVEFGKTTKTRRRFRVEVAAVPQATATYIPPEVVSA